MAAPVIRRAKREPAVTTADAAPMVTRVGVPKVKLTADEERELVLGRMRRDRRIHVEVVAEFKEHGARVDLGDPMKSARDEYRCGEA